MNLNETRNFIINGQIKSYEDLGVFVTKMPPVPKPQRSIESIQVSGSNKVLHIDNGNYLPINYSFTILLLDPKKIDDFKLKSPIFGQIEFSIYPGKVYSYCLKNQIDFSLYANTCIEIPIQLELQPLAESPEKSFTFTSNSNFYISGSENSFPVLKLTGKGTITLNSKKIKTTEENIIIDCELMEAFNEAKLNKNDKVIIDDFPCLNPGLNNITFDSTITKVEVIYRERWS